MGQRLHWIYSSVFLMSMGLSFDTQAIDQEKILKTLRDRVVTHPVHKTSFIKSYGTRDVSYIYDQALAIMAFTHANDQKHSRNLLKTMEKLSKSDGPLHFAYMTEGSSAFAGDEVRVIHGALAWVAMSANYYQKQFKSREFAPFTKTILTYLDTQKMPALGGHAIQFSQKDLSTTAWDETKVLALEHNIDAYSAFKIYGELNHDKKFIKTSKEIKKFITGLWDPQKKFFWSGYDLTKNRINKDEIYLDNQTWTLLAIDEKDLSVSDANHALDKACESFYYVAKDKGEEIHGFFDRKSSRAPAYNKFVWSEGTAGKLLASKFNNPLSDYSCQSTTEKDFKNSFEQMKQTDGGISYATATSNIDFTTDSSIAGTAWAYFYLVGLNPFKLNELKDISPLKVGDNKNLKSSTKTTKLTSN